MKQYVVISDTNHREYFLIKVNKFSKRKNLFKYAGNRFYIPETDEYRIHIDFEPEYVTSSVKDVSDVKFNYNAGEIIFKDSFSGMYVKSNKDLRVEYKCPGVKSQSVVVFIEKFKYIDENSAVLYFKTKYCN